MTLSFHAHPALLTDLYQLTMGAAYHQNQIERTSSFELFVRKLPPQRSFLIAAGLEQICDYLQNLHFDGAEIEYLKGLAAFRQVKPEFFESLKDFRFTGEVWAVPEGTVVFPNEPVIRVTAPVEQAQLVETFLLTSFNFQTLIATKAARIWLACHDGPHQAEFIDFGTRRAHGPEAGVLAARAAYIGGALGTANVYAGMHCELPVFGTAAHSWTMAFENEQDAFEAYHQVFPEHTTLLIDTYDTLEGARRAVQIGTSLKGVRLDSGDFAILSRQVREILDQAGLTSTQIVVSGDMNEAKIEQLLASESPINTFGVGTELTTSLDAPALAGVYKLVEQRFADGQTDYAIKLSEGKASYPGAKQIARFYDSQGYLLEDRLMLAHETIPEGGFALLELVMAQGQRVKPLPSLNSIRERTLQQLNTLPKALRRLGALPSYQVTHSPALQDLFVSLKARYGHLN